MCIVLISNQHPSYPLILASNRDEYLGRPTLQADFWIPPNGHVLGGRDLFRPVQGTWLGVTQDGRLAVLTNYREDKEPANPAAVSRGEMVNAFLTAPAEDVANIEDFVKRLISGDAARGSGGFSLVCGRIGQALAVVSNRMQQEGEVKWIGRDGGKETVGLSNAAFGDQSWPKVVNGTRLMEDLMKDWIENDVDREQIAKSLFDLLSTDTLPVPKPGEGWETSVKQLRNSIFIPRLGGGAKAGGEPGAVHDPEDVPAVSATSGLYGTQKQTVVIMDKYGHLFFTEKTLFDEHGRDIREDLDSIRSFEFEIS